MSNPTDKTPPEQKRVESIGDFFAALRSDEPEIRRATLKAVAQSPDKALLFGRYHDRDIIDELVCQLTSARDESVRQALLAALIAFDDLRVTACTRRVFKADSHPGIIFMAAGRLAMAPEKEVVDFFGRFLFDAPTTAHARAAARVLTRCPTLSIKRRLRVVLLAGDDGLKPPVLNKKTFSIWLAELQGVLARSARGLLIAQGEIAFKTLSGHWDDLPEAIRSWTLAWGAGAFPAHTVALILKALESCVTDLELAGLKAIARYGDYKGLFAGPLKKIDLSGRDAAFVSAAVTAGIPIAARWNQMMAQGDMATRLAVISRLYEVEGKPAVRHLIKMLSEDNWRIRSAARDAMINMGDIPVDKIVDLAKTGDHHQQAAAIQILIGTGHETELSSLPLSSCC